MRPWSSLGWGLASRALSLAALAGASVRGKGGFAHGRAFDWDSVSEKGGFAHGKESLASEDAVSGLPKIVTLSLEVSERGLFSFGFVYNLHNIYDPASFPWPWCDLYINSVELIII